MSFIQAMQVVINHPFLRTQMGSLFETADDISKIPNKEFEEFYADFVQTAVENVPELAI